MRIRKSQLLFPFSSSLSPVPLSDPHLINPSPVVQLGDDIPLPPDHPLSPIAKPVDLSDDSSGGAAVPAGSGALRQPQKQYGLEEDGVRRRRGEEGEKSNDARKGSISDSQTVTDHVLSHSSPSNEDDERWCEGEKAIPFKKRRGSFQRIIKVEDYNEEVTTHHKKEKTRMKKTKMNKKISRQNTYDDDDDEEDNATAEDGGEREKKRAGGKRGRGNNVVMEGSRCSRVNGRGWRCCQQTLVGYSLCEHHLGKGRLRSITSVKTRTLPASKLELQVLSPQVSTYDVRKQRSCEVEEEEKQGMKKEGDEIVVVKKRMKLGVVKARSLSSLLQQTSNHVTVVDHNK